MHHPARISGWFLRLGSENSIPQMRKLRLRERHSSEWQKGTQTQVWVPLGLQVVVPLPSSCCPHPGVLPSSHSPASPGSTPGFQLPFCYKSPCAPGSWCLPSWLPLPSPCSGPSFRYRVFPLHLLVGGEVGVGPWKQPGALWQILCCVLSP